MLMKQISKRCFGKSTILWRRYATLAPWHQPVGPYTGLNVYNCVLKQTAPVVFPNDHIVSWYTCGPTVYDQTHLGHASCYVKLDIIQRILKNYFKINLVTAMNITDIDDKIIKRSNEEGKYWRELALEYEKNFFNDMNKLRVSPPDIKMNVTHNISLIISFISKLISNGQAYAVKDGSVYFDVKKYAKYGKLEKIKLDESMKSSKNQLKLSDADFALWKGQKEPQEPSWNSPWGPGRPGWHIECSALASSMFGSNIDFHAGGIDLRFPHHENEDAQSCCYHQTNQWVNYWLHTGHLYIKGDEHKMSKSLQNTISIDDMLGKYDCDAFRMACLLSNYRNSMEYSDEMMETAVNVLRKFRTFESDCKAYVMGIKPAVNINSRVMIENLQHTIKEVHNGLCDDFNTAYTMSVLSDLMSSTCRNINNNSSVNVDSSCLELIAAALNFVTSTMNMFGISMGKTSSSHALADEEDNLGNIISGIIDSRRQLREKAIAQKSHALFEVCDELRQCLRANGIEVKDHSHGSTWEFIRKTNNQ